MKMTSLKSNFISSVETKSQASCVRPALARVALLAVVCATGALRALAEDASPGRSLDLPSPVCDTIAVPEGNKLSAHFYAAGVQIYRWSGSNWVFIAPEATLYANSCHRVAVGTHYAGPTWETVDGSKVIAARVDGCSPDRGAIPWLLLARTAASEHGRLARTTYIQRVNTVGGTAPAEAGLFVGDEARVPYTTEYVFYRAARN